MAKPRLPQGLIDAINAGECVAFVGAGFSAAANLPQWPQLLAGIAKARALDKQAKLRRYVLRRIKEGTAHALDEAAQVLQDSLGTREFLSRLEKALVIRRISRRMRDRLRYVRGIPFRAILTVNFDDLLKGMTPSSGAYRAVLRPQAYRWWDSLFWQRAPKGATLVKLHGDLAEPSTIVFTRRGYRRRLYSDPAYMSFLRSILAQQTVLYLGFSFADAYLNELRSEVLAMLGQARGSAPIAYAVLNDVAEAARDQLMRTEGVDAISYNSKRPANYTGFDAILEELHERTNPSLRLSRLLAGRRILWVIRADYDDGGRFLRVFDRLRATNRTERVRIVRTPDASAGIAALEQARERGATFDLVITHWGGSGPGGPTAVQLLRQMRSRRLETPVVVFASAYDMNRRKRMALSLGAQGYTNSYEALLRAIERIFAPGVETA
jgi:CheY-like chemotaxis protein